MTDIHVHTAYSADSAAKPRDIIAEAERSGLSGVCFTDHWDVGYDSINGEKIIPREYADCDLRGLRSDGGFKILCGIELGPMTHVLDRVKTEMSGVDFDFILLSAHYVGSVPQVRYDGYFMSHTKKEAYESYLSTLISLISQYGDYDALGHFDYISRYSPYPDPLMRYRDHEALFDELFTLLIKPTPAVEVNTGKHRIIKNRLPIDREILTRYRDLGGELICLGSDAHRSGDVGFMFAAYRDILLECGFRRAVYYVGRKPFFYELR